MELVNYRLEFGCWLFGHYQDNRTIDLRHILLLKDIKQLTQCQVGKILAKQREAREQPPVFLSALSQNNGNNAGKERI